MGKNYIYESRISNLKIEHVENKILGTDDYHNFYIVLCDDIQIAVSEHLTAEALTELIEGRDTRLTTVTRQRDEAVKLLDDAVLTTHTPKTNTKLHQIGVWWDDVHKFLTKLKEADDER